jgi:cyanate permease
MALMTLGGGVAGVFVILIGALVDAVGWRDALRIIAVVIAVTGLIPILNTRSRPRDHPQPMDGLRIIDQPLGGPAAPPDHWGIPVRRAVRSRAFVFLTIALAGGMFGTNAFVALQIPFLVDTADASRAAAGATVALFTLSSIIGRLGFGFLADRYDKRLMLLATMVIIAAGAAFLPLVHNIWQAVPIIVLIAIGFGGAIPVRPALVADYFGTRYFGTMNGLTTTVRTMGAVIGPPVVGIIVDITGAYTLGWVLVAVVVAATVPFLWLARPPEDLIEEYRRDDADDLARAASGTRSSAAPAG